MFMSHNQNTVRTSGAGWHDGIKQWEKGVDVLLDGVVHEEPDMLESNTGLACHELELELGHKVLAGELTVEEAYDRLGQ